MVKFLSVLMSLSCLLGTAAYAMEDDNEQGQPVSTKLSKEKVSVNEKFSINFAKDIDPSIKVTGLAKPKEGEEPRKNWGMITDGEKVSIVYPDPLPNKFRMILTFGNTCLHDGSVKVGNQTTKFKVPVGGIDLGPLTLDLNNNGKSKSLEFVFPGVLPLEQERASETGMPTTFYFRHLAVEVRQ